MGEKVPHRLRGKSKSELRALHAPHLIRRRLSKRKEVTHVPDAVLGAIDGTVTTFAVIAAAAGAGLGPGVAIVLGGANLLSDGLSMAVGNYQANKTEVDFLHEVRKAEEEQVDKFPEGEKEEIRQIYAAKGFSGELLEKVVGVICENREHWINTMLREEHGLSTSLSSPVKAGLTTFVAFVVAGAIPLLPFVGGIWLGTAQVFMWSILLTLVTFFFIGWLKGGMVGGNKLKGGLETLVVGGLAAFVAFQVGSFLEGFVPSHFFE